MTSKLLKITAVSLTAVLVGCGSDSNSTTHSAAPTGQPKTVTVALSWTPNTDYTGIYAAQAAGNYRERGINLKIIPYASTPPETLVSAGKADIAFSYQAGLTYSRAGGSDLVSIFVPDQKNAYAIAVRADLKAFKSPKTLAGKP